MADTYVEIAPFWRIGLPADASGIALYVDRGIPCEGHTQVVSKHFTNQPELRDIAEAFEKHKDYVTTLISKFVDLMQAWGYGEGGSSAKEAIGYVVYYQILGVIGREAEKICEHRHWGAGTAV